MAFAQQDNAELLEFLITQNELAREKLESISYTIQWESEVDMSEGRRFNRGSGQVIIRGDHRWSTYENLARIPSTEWEQVQSGRIVVNDRSMGEWPAVGNHYACQYDHSSIEAISEENRVRLLMGSPRKILEGG